MVPVHLLGTAIGVKNGGLLDHQVHEVEVQCVPKNLPDSLELDISHLEINDAVHVSDFKLPEGVELSLEGDVVVAMVAELKALAAEEEEEAAAADTPSEPELVGGEKKEEESE
jgi:large subunit ribosomal protein L25